MGEREGNQGGAVPVLPSLLYSEAFRLQAGPGIQPVSTVQRLESNPLPPPLLYPVSSISL